MHLKQRYAKQQKQIGRTTGITQQGKENYYYSNPEGKKNTFNLLHTNSFLLFARRNLSQKGKSADSKQAKTVVSFPLWSCNLCVSVSLISEARHPRVNVHGLFSQCLHKPGNKKCQRLHYIYEMQNDTVGLTLSCFRFFGPVNYRGSTY